MARLRKRQHNLLVVLEQHFRTNAYIDGFVFSERDEAFMKACAVPKKEVFPNAHRW